MEVKILSLNRVNNFNYINPRKKETEQVNFEAAPVKEIKNLYGLVCPSCGGQIIQPQKLAQAYKQLTFPLSKMIKKGYMDKTKNYPTIWVLLNELAKKNPDLSLDKILEDEETYLKFKRTVEVCVLGDDLGKPGTYLVKKRTIDGLENNIKSASRAELRSASVVMNRLKSFLPLLENIEKSMKYKNFIRSKKEAFEELMYYAKIYPRKRISEILNMQNVHYYLENSNKSYMANLKHKRDIQLTKIENILKRFIKNKPKEYYDDIRQNAVSTFYGQDVSTEVKYNKVKKIYQEILQEHNAEKYYKEISDLIDEIPELGYSKYKELLKYYGKNDDSKIIDSILKPFVGSMEHIQAISNGGPDVRSNQIGMHKGCNTLKGSYVYSEYVEIYPNFPNLVEKQIKQISNAICKKELLGNYWLYPLQVSWTLKKESDGKIDIDNKKYAAKAYELLAEQISEIDKNIIEIVKLRDFEIAKLRSSNFFVRSVKRKIERYNAQYEKLISEIKLAKQMLRTLRGYLANSNNN